MFQLLSTQHPGWMAYINKNPQATIFHHPAWIKNLKDSYGYKGWIAAEMEDDQIIAGLPVMRVGNSLTGSHIVALPFSDYCKPLARDAAALNSLIASLIKWSSECRLPLEVRWQLPEMQEIKTAHNYVFHTTRLDPDPVVVFERIHQRVRRYLRSTTNRDIRIEQSTSEEFLRQFYHLQLLTRRKHGLPAQPWRYFQYFRENLLEQGLGFILLAFIGDECQAGLIVLHWGNTLTFKYAASIEDHLKDMRPNHLLVWSAIRWGCEHGYQVLDVGRSDIEQVGLRDYKKRWGYQEDPLDYSYIGGDPPRDTTKGMFGRIFRSVLQHSPLWLCQATGDLLYAHFP